MRHLHHLLTYLCALGKFWSSIKESLQCFWVTFQWFGSSQQTFKLRSLCHSELIQTSILSVIMITLGPNLSRSVSVRVQMAVCSNLRLLRWHFQSNIEQVPQSLTLLISQPRVYIYLFISSLFNLLSPPLSLIAHLGYLALCLSVPFLLLFFCYFFCFGAFFFLFSSLLWCSVLAGIIAKSCCCFWTCDGNSAHGLVVMLAYTHCWELMKLLGKLWYLSCYLTCYCWWSFNKCETVTVEVLLLISHSSSSVFLLHGSAVLIWKSFFHFQACPGFLSCKYRDFLILMRTLSPVIYVVLHSTSVSFSCLNKMSSSCNLFLTQSTST